MRPSFLPQTLLTALLVVSLVWLVLPFALAVLWSLVDPDYVWTSQDVFPQSLSLRRWQLLWDTTTLKSSLMNSYALAFCASLTTLTLAIPTAYAFGRLNFRGKVAAQNLVMLPLVIPGFVSAIFFSAVLNALGVESKFLGILLGHTVFLLPYAVRVLTVSFGNLRQDLIDAARDLGARRITLWREVYFPTLKPGFLASLILVFALSIEEFSLSFIIGSPDFTTVPTLLFSFLGYQFVRPNAAVISLALVIPNLVLLLFVERALKVVNPAVIHGKG